MYMKILKPMRFDEYYTTSYGMNLDLRPAEEILEEVKNIREKLTEEQDGPV